MVWGPFSSHSDVAYPTPGVSRASNGVRNPRPWMGAEEDTGLQSTTQHQALPGLSLMIWLKGAEANWKMHCNLLESHNLVLAQQGGIGLWNEAEVFSNNVPLLGRISPS